MDLQVTPEQQLLQASVRVLLEDQAGPTRVREAMDSATGVDRATWSALVEIGAVGLGIPDADGGSGGSFQDVAIVVEELGASLACVPYLSTRVLAGTALQGCAARSEPARQQLHAIAAGELLATVVFGGAGLSVAADGAGHHLDGVSDLVVDGHVADLFVVFASMAGTQALWLVLPDAGGISRQPLTVMDQTRRLAEVGFSRTPALLLASGQDAEDVLLRVQQAAAVALALEAVGGMQRCLDMSVNHAKERVQFGVPIGSFQAVQHKCADMLVAVELARSAASYGAWAMAEADEPELRLASHVAKSWCCDAYVEVAAETIQVHGGTGFTWDHPAHLYYKRAKSSQILFGTPGTHRAELADLLSF